MRIARASTGLKLLAAAVTTSALSLGVASAQPVPPGWAGPHYFSHGHYWHHRAWMYRNHHRFYRYY